MPKSNSLEENFVKRIYFFINPLYELVAWYDSTTSAEKRSVSVSRSKMLVLKKSHFFHFTAFWHLSDESHKSDWPIAAPQQDWINFFLQRSLVSLSLLAFFLFSRSCFLSLVSLFYSAICSLNFLFFSEKKSRVVNIPIVQIPSFVVSVVDWERD